MAGYGDDGGFTAWLTANGYTLPGGGPAVAVLRQRGSVYVDGIYALRFPGQPTGGAVQERQWPRTSATDRYGNALDSTAVPARVVEASYVDTIEREIFEPGGDESSTPVMSQIEGILTPLLTAA